MSRSMVTLQPERNLVQNRSFKGLALYQRFRVGPEIPAMGE